MTEMELKHFRAQVVALEEQRAMETLNRLLADEVEPWAIMNCLNESLIEVGRLYQAGEYYMTGLVLAGEIMRQGLEALLPRLTSKEPRKSRGLVIIGTIEGDIHDLGKNMARGFLEADGFEVVDLGVDVPPRVFLKEILQREPDAVGVSLLMTTALVPLKRLARLVKDAFEDRPAPPIFVGCGLLGQADDLSTELNWDRQLLGVDHVVHSAYDTLKLCREVVRGRNGLSETPPVSEAVA